MSGVLLCVETPVQPRFRDDTDHCFRFGAFQCPKSLSCSLLLGAMMPDSGVSLLTCPPNGPVRFARVSAAPGSVLFFSYSQCGPSSALLDVTMDKLVSKTLGT